MPSHNRSSLRARYLPRAAAAAPTELGQMRFIDDVLQSRRRPLQVILLVEGGYYRFHIFTILLRHYVKQALVSIVS